MFFETENEGDDILNSLIVQSPGIWKLLLVFLSSHPSLLYAGKITSVFEDPMLLTAENCH